jgi:hypothetical protein
MLLDTFSRMDISKLLSCLEQAHQATVFEFTTTLITEAPYKTRDAPMK